ncbi:MAG TPA: TraB/GumN family protein [Rhodothermales bacterium]|nr:TraB/GumN family protein [Rhodothermales bacterium]
MNRVRDEYMVAAIRSFVARGERVFAVVGASHVVMQEPALREFLTSDAP